MSRKTGMSMLIEKVLAIKACLLGTVTQTLVGVCSTWLQIDLDWL